MAISDVSTSALIIYWYGCFLCILSAVIGKPLDSLRLSMGWFRFTTVPWFDIMTWLYMAWYCKTNGMRCQVQVLQTFGCLWNWLPNFPFYIKIHQIRQCARSGSIVERLVASVDHLWISSRCTSMMFMCNSPVLLGALKVWIGPCSSVPRNWTKELLVRTECGIVASFKMICDLKHITSPQGFGFSTLRWFVRFYALDW